jgi:transposase
MALADSDLPDDVETLKAMLVSARTHSIALAAEAERLRAAKADADTRIERLHTMLKALQRGQFGRRSEALDPGQLDFVFEEIETGVAAIQARLDTAASTRIPPSRRRKTLPAHLERVESILAPDLGPCGCGACQWDEIGEDVSERLDVVPARFRVLVTRRPRYACRACHEAIRQAPAPARLIEAGLPTERLLAQVAVAKYSDAQPLYRQERIFAREGVDLSRQVLAGWMGHVGFHLEPLADRILQIIRAGPRVFADETTLPMLAPGLGRTRKAWLWTYARDDRPFGGTDPAMVAYRFEDSREAECPLRHLAGFSGLLQTDGYTAYNRLTHPARQGGPVTPAACWAHLRRKFYELHVAGVSQTATWSIERMATLWAIEGQVRGHGPEIRQSARAASSVPIVAELFERWQTELGRIPGKSKLAEAIRYALARRAAFERFLHDGRHRQQHRRARHPSSDPHAKKCSLRRLRSRWRHLGHHRYPSRDGSPQRRRSTGLADAHA